MVISKTTRMSLKENLGHKVERAVWASNSDSLLPIQFNDVDLKAIVPAIIYILRFEARPGKGLFTSSFNKKGDSSGRKDKVTANDIADLLLDPANRSRFQYDSEPETAHRIFSNALAGLVFENRQGKRGTNHAIIRTRPNHFMSAKFDLPEHVSHLRGIPELTVSALVGGPQGRGQKISTNIGQTSTHQGFKNYASQALSRKFAGAVRINPNQSEFNTGNPQEEIDEALAEALSIDQILQIRTAECIPAFPKRQATTSKSFVPLRVITERQWEIFQSDLRHFIRYFSENLSRIEFTSALEMIIGVNLFAITNSYCKTMNSWSDKGVVPSRESQTPYPVFMDCSGGDNRAIRLAAEESWDGFSKKITASAVAIKAYQFIEHFLESDSSIEQTSKSTNGGFSEQSPGEKLRLAGEILTNENHNINIRIDSKIRDFLNDISTETKSESLKRLYRMEEFPAMKAGTIVTDLMGTSLTVQKMLGMLKDLLQDGEGPATAMIVWRQTRNKGAGNSKTRVVREVVASDIFLETFVHRLIIDPKDGDRRELTVRDFIDEISSRYGLFIDSNSSASNSLLFDNRKYLEERLRALGLLMGVNDSENMKLLRPRFPLQDNLSTDDSLRIPNK